MKRLSSRVAVALVASGAALVAVLWLLVLPSDSSVTSDDGAYAIQARAAADGEWSVPHVLAPVDPAGRTYPFLNSPVGENGFFPGGAHVAWAWLDGIAFDVVGEAGLRVLPIVGFAGAIGATALLAHRMRQRQVAVLAAAIVVCSPMLFNALQLWAHTSVSALVAFVMAVSLRARTDGSAGASTSAVAAAAAAGLLRADGAVFALATGVVLTAWCVRDRRIRGAATGIAVSAGAVLGYVGSERLSADLIGDPISGRGPIPEGGAERVDSVSSAVRGVIHTFLSWPDDPASFLVLAVAGSATVVAVLAARRGDRTATFVFLALAAACWVVRVVMWPDQLATGLLLAFPVALLSGVRGLRALRSEERFVATALVLAGAGIAATQYDVGGGTNWGGRFLAPALPAIAVFAAVGVRELVARPATGSDLRIVLAALVVIPAVGSLVVDARTRLRHDEIVERLDDVPRDLPVLTAHPAIPRLAWRTVDERNWLRLPDTVDGFDADLARRLLEEQGIRRVVLFGVPSSLVEELLEGRGAGIDTERPVVVDI